MRARGLFWLGSAALFTGIAGFASSIVMIVRPSIDRPNRADAVVVLSGDNGGRLPRALRLIRAGVAPVLVIDGVPDLAETKALCRSSTEFEVVCLRPEPDTTRTEARAAGRLAAERGWRRVVLVTDTVHVERARLLFERCVRGSVSIVEAAPVPGIRSGWRGIAHEWVGVAYALTVARGC